MNAPGQRTRRSPLMDLSSSLPSGESSRAAYAQPQSLHPDRFSHHARLRGYQDSGHHNAMRLGSERQPSLSALLSYVVESDEDDHRAALAASAAMPTAAGNDLHPRIASNHAARLSRARLSLNDLMDADITADDLQPDKSRSDLHAEGQGTRFSGARTSSPLVAAAATSGHQASASPSDAPPPSSARCHSRTRAAGADLGELTSVRVRAVQAVTYHSCS